jgi:C-terminal peptidase prc
MEKEKEKKMDEFDEASSIVQEVWEVVDKHFLDARGGGYSSKRWLELRREALAQLDKSQSFKLTSLPFGASDYAKNGQARKIAKQMLKKGIPKVDPYTRFLYPKEFDRLAKYDISGIGINLGTRDEYVTRVDKNLPMEIDKEDGMFLVLGVIKDSPSELAGIRQGDLLVAIEGARPSGITPLQAAQRIQQAQKKSDKGAVSLTFRRAADGEVADVVVRGKKGRGGEEGDDSVVPTPVEYALKRGRGGAREGYIDVQEFNARSSGDVRKAVEVLEAQGANYFVLDLRDNLGGLVPAGVDVSTLFVGSKTPIVYTMTKDSGLQDRAPHAATYQPPITDKPLIVLVNKRTASASEIVAGALKDNCRASLVGDQATFGKGLIQSVYELSDGSGLIVTVGKYVTPAQVDIDKHGISTNFKSIPTLEQQQEYIAACKLKTTL